jgi:ethanolamine utilization microcompartment shell protein EutS
MVDVPAVAVELAELLAVVVGAGAASAIGIVLERFGLSAASAGDLVLGAWAVGMGLLALYVGVVALGYEQALPRLRRLAAGE